MRRFPVMLAAAVVGLAGCSFSDIDPDADVAISGRALTASGQPMADAEVLLFRHADLGQIVFGTVFTIGSLGAACLLPERPSICEQARRATTDGSGHYSYDLKGEDTQGSLGTEAKLSVVVAGRGGRTTTVTFTAEQTTIELPDARIWNARATASPGGAGTAISWRPLPGDAGSDPVYSAEFIDAGTGDVLWSEPASGGEARLDPRILEDRSGRIAVSAGANPSGGSGAGDVHAYHRSASRDVGAQAGAPPSRGRPCAVVTGTEPEQGRFGECPATDGELGQPAHLAGNGDRVVTGVVIDLGRARPVDLVVARGLAGQFLVEASTDGTSYQTVATGSGRAAALEPTRPTSARYVRLRSPTGIDQSLLAEVSVW